MRVVAACDIQRRPAEAPHLHETQHEQEVEPGGPAVAQPQRGVGRGRRQHRRQQLVQQHVGDQRGERRQQRPREVAALALVREDAAVVVLVLVPQVAAGAGAGAGAGVRGTRRVVS